MLARPPFVGRLGRRQQVLVLLGRLAQQQPEGRRGQVGRAILLAQLLGHDLVGLQAALLESGEQQPPHVAGSLVGLFQRHRLLAGGRVQQANRRLDLDPVAHVDLVGDIGAVILGDGEQPIPAYIQALLEQTADSLDNLQRTMSRGEEGRAQANANLNALANSLADLTDQMRSEQHLLKKLADAQSELRPALATRP